MTPTRDPSATTRVIHAACPHDCPDTCAIRVTVEGERLIRLQGEPDHPTTHGALCTKVSRYAERNSHPERVLQPLRRVGPKGSGQFEPVGWDEALDDIAARLKAIAARDPQAILPYSYAGTMGFVQGEAMAGRFFHRLGASQLNRTICAEAGATGLALTYGATVGMHLEHFAESRLILIWGSNSIASNLHFWTYAQAAKRAGAKLIAIDPRRTETAEKCHQHIALRPGTDSALALGLMHELVVNDWLDHDYLTQHVEGWPELRERALRWPPERAAEVCGISADEVRGLARDYGTTAPAAIRLNYGMQRVAGGGNAARLIALLPCLVGAWRHRAGGLLLSASGWNKPFRNRALERPDLLAGRQPRSINMSTIGDDLLREASPAFGPRIEALIVYNSNPVAVAPESAKVVAGFRREDLFTVVLEHFLTDTADHADYVLPATTQLEHWDVHASYGHTYLLINEPALPPAGQARSNAEIFRQLAARMGFDEPCFQDDDLSLARQAFEVDFDELRRVGWLKLPVPEAPFAEGRFFTASGKARACAPCLPLPDHVPNHESAERDPALAQRYPLAMISPPSRNFLNSTFVNVKSLRDIEGEPLLEICDADAQARGLVDGQPVRVFNDRGEYHCVARVSPRARPGVVNGLGVWWRKLGRNGTNVNQLTHQRLTDLGEAPCFYDCLVEVAPL
ncbi:molybdopterin oxidoreductase family protein [Ideonella dechloratans]|uniref:Molybdopterin oxidoreductase family protein n=1 Tax=Ideonella dechloratans TaxID=36863 RepID=A0A643FJ52_IDEDE|nr:molybdopterin oxidoreductase family protein [Ideonella dechloratans]KAB0584420.1 molybdopterin oxidoreductase family protein [Ideonella dechloratans]UFU10860.1 molybdopterin oxidoreductase family protein [Ideonella dechloratans]